MNRSLFIGILVITGLMVLASSLPNKFYAASDRKFVTITIITSAIAAIGLAIFFSIPFLSGQD
jgi:aspartyl/asparaginyl beta-hydroxylase (cupin superfamily)